MPAFKPKVDMETFYERLHDRIKTMAWLNMGKMDNVRISFKELKDLMRK